MKKLLLNTFFFLFLSVVLPAIIVFFLPPTPRAQSTLLFAGADKDTLLKNTPSPRIIFVGGSNLSFGLNSRLIKDSLGLNPVNTGIHASLGLLYMLDKTKKYIQEGDIVVVVPEYAQFYDNFAFGGEELLRTVCDVDARKELLNLRIQQVGLIAPFFPKYLRSKLNPYEYRSFTPDKWYSRSSFNEFGDADAHWDEPSQQVLPYKTLTGPFNGSVVEELKGYQELVTARKAKMYLSFPCFQSASFDNSADQIRYIEQVLRKGEVFDILGSPERYKVPDTMLFNTPYHLIKKGIDHRTLLLIGDMRKALSSSLHHY